MSDQEYGLKEVVVVSIMYDLVNKTPVVILKEMNEDRYLPILIGIYEASAIEMGLKNKPFPRPMTHDLLSHILEKLQKSVEFVHITHIEESTFYANIVIYNDGEKLEIDARPSDAIALALRTKAPLLVSEEILTQAGIPLKAMKPEQTLNAEDLMNDEILKNDNPDFKPGFPRRRRPDDTAKFKDFLRDVTPEDFFKDLDEDEDLGEFNN